MQIDNATYIKRNNFIVGMLASFTGALSWGFSGTSINYLFDRYHMSPLFLTCVRMLGAGLVLLAVLPDKKRLSAMIKDARTRRRLMVFGGFGLFLNSILFTTTISYTNAGTATVIQNINAALVLAYICISTPRKPRALETIALILALFATYLIATQGDWNSLQLNPKGLAVGIATGFVAAFYIVYPSKLFERWGALYVTCLGMLVCGVVALIAIVLFGGSALVPTLDARGIGLLIATILVGTLIAYGLFLYGSSAIGSVYGSMLGAIEPVSATVFSALWLSTSFSGADIVGLIMMVASVCLIALQGKQH